jgi:hypothetical protein
VRRGVTAAGTAAAVTGTIVDKIRKAKTVVQAQGYSPNVLAIDPSGAEALDLLVTGISGGVADYVFTPGQPAPAPWGLQVRIWKNSGAAVLDANSLEAVHQPDGVEELRGGCGLVETRRMCGWSATPASRSSG